MWIRSQNKTKLLDVHDIRVAETNPLKPLYCSHNDSYDIICDDNDFIIGHYSTKEKALKVLDDIQMRIIACECAKMMANMIDRCFTPTINDKELMVFEMPKDEEVKV